MKKNFRLAKRFLVLASIIVFSVILSANCFAVVPVQTIGEDEFLFINTHVSTEGIGEVGEYKVIDSPTYFYWADQKKLTSYTGIPDYNAATQVIVGSEVRFSGTAGIGSASELAAYDTLSVKDKFSIDYDLSVSFYMNNQWRKVKIGETWTQTVETDSEKGGMIRTIYTIKNFGIHKKSNIIATGVSTPTPQPTSTPTIKPSPKKYSISGYISSDSSLNSKEFCDNFKVDIQGIGISVLTDKNGYFKLESVLETSSPGSLYLITISKKGYLTRSVSTQLLQDIEMGSASQPIPMIAGDINADNAINMSDIICLANSFNTKETDKEFNFAADLNFDKVINMGDVIIIAKNFNKTSADYTNPSITGINNIKLFKDDFTDIILREGQGLTWDYSISNNNVIRFESKSTGTLQYSEGLPGSLWTFKALQAGTATITFTSSFGNIQKYNITVTDDKYNITVKKNETFEITQREGGIADISWDYAISNDDIVILQSKNVTYRGIDFSDVTWTFKGISQGTTSINFFSDRGNFITYPITVINDVVSPTPTSTQSSATASSEPQVVHSRDLKATQISTDSEQKIQLGKNIVFCPTFQMAWDQFKGVIGGDLKLSGNPPLAATLNKGFSMTDSLSPASYVSKGGYGQETVDKINTELKSKFKNPSLLEIQINPLDIIAYSYLEKNISFPKTFETINTPLDFKSGSMPGKVKAFGINRYSDKYYELAKQISIYDYKSDNDFIVKLQGQSDLDEIILAKVSPEESLYKTYSSVMNRIKNSQTVPFRNCDTLQIPVFDFNIEHNYTEFEGKSLLNPGFTAYCISTAYQRTRFKLDENGAVLVSVATIIGTTSIQTPPTPKSMVFDGPFMVIMKEKGAENPYFIVWVDNTELLLSSNQ